MIPVHEVLKAVPHFETFCSVQKLHDLVKAVRTDRRFQIEVAGTSSGGVPIYHLRFGTGAVKALIVAGSHAMEPIGSLTVFTLITLLHESHPALLDADVEWHIVPCIDPDGAILNEGWTQKPFTFESYLRNRFVQASKDQVDSSFPIAYKSVVLNDPSSSARVLKGILDRVRPDFYFALHNAWVGGAFYYISHDIDHRFYGQLYELLKIEDFPLQRRPIFKEVCAPFSEGVVEQLSVRKWFDYLEQTGSEKLFVSAGAGSWDYLEEIKPGALSFIAETGYARHSHEESEEPTSENLRRFLLRLSSDNKYLASVLLEEWDKVKGGLDSESPFYRAILGGMAFPLDRDKLCEGGFPISWYPTRDILFGSEYDRPMTEGDRFNACMVDSGFLFPLYSYQFMRLLKASRQTPVVVRAIERLEKAFDGALDEFRRHVNFEAFEAYDCDTLARVQLGSGLIVLNSLLEKSRHDGTR